MGVYLGKPVMIEVPTYSVIARSGIAEIRRTSSVRCLSVYEIKRNEKVIRFGPTRVDWCA